MQIKEVLEQKSIYYATDYGWQYQFRKDKILTVQQYELTISKDTVQWFRNLGGTEKLVRADTPHGDKVVRLCSTSPDKTELHIREFTFLS